MSKIQEEIKNRILVLDGAMGTMLQRYKFEEEDFLSYLENKKIEITEFIKNNNLHEERKDNLTKAGYDYKVVQDKVNKLLSTPVQPRFKKGDRVIPTNLVDYDGRFLKKYDDTYEVLEDSKADRVVLAARRNGRLVVWAAMNTKNVRRV